MGAFGLLDRPQDDRLPLDRFVEENPSLDVHHLARQGLLTEGAKAAVQTAQGGCLRLGHTAGKLEIDGQPIEVSWHPQLPLRVFVCPTCSRDCYKLHEVSGRWACRTCHRLTYSSRHRNRTIPGYNRALWLRRRLGASPELFSPIAPRGPQAWRYRALAAELRRIEEGLVDHLRHDVTDVIERRHARSRGRSPKPRRGC